MTKRKQPIGMSTHQAGAREAVIKFLTTHSTPAVWEALRNLVVFHEHGRDGGAWLTAKLRELETRSSDNDDNAELLARFWFNNPVVKVGSDGREHRSTSKKDFCKAEAKARSREPESLEKRIDRAIELYGDDADFKANVDLYLAMFKAAGVSPGPLKKRKRRKGHSD